MLAFILLPILFALYDSVLTVPGAVPSQSLRATPFEDRILLYWKEPSEPNGVIIQYEVRPKAAGNVFVIGAEL